MEVFYCRLGNSLAHALISPLGWVGLGWLGDGAGLREVKGLASETWVELWLWEGVGLG